jgi:hypothetical protein
MSYEISGKEFRDGHGGKKDSEEALARHDSLLSQLALRASFAVRYGILPSQSSEGWNPAFFSSSRRAGSQPSPG